MGDKMKRDEFLNLKLNLLDQIYENTLQQTNAIDNKDEQALEKLLQLRQELMDQVDRIDIAFGQTGGVSEEEQHIKKMIKDKLQLIYAQNQQNLLKAEQYKKELSNEIYHMNQGKKALAEGYFKPYSQAYGYYVDKKIGK